MAPLNYTTTNSRLYTFEEFQKIDQLTKQYPWLKLGKDGVLEMYCDHHMLSTLRTCEAKFELEILRHWEPRKGNWSLSFGSFFHKCMEWFDEAEEKGFGLVGPTAQWNKPPVFTREFLLRHKMPQWVGDSEGPFTVYKIDHISWILQAKQYWEEHNLGQFVNENGFKELEGWPGAQVLLLSYWNQYGSGKERLRTVGTELCFGRDKEAPILTDPYLYKWAPFRAYLTGRIDRVVDNGSHIGPLDRKTHRYFKQEDTSGVKYKPHDAFLGYSYAVERVLGDRFKAQGKSCDAVITDLISLSEPGPKSKVKTRFMRSYRNWSAEEKAEFVLRQTSTFSRIYNLMVLGKPPEWTTTSCHNQYYKACPYRPYHEIAPAGREDIFGTLYQIRKTPWSPFEIPEDKQVRIEEGV